MITELGYFELFIYAVFANNIVLAQYLGNCPFIGCSKNRGTAAGMGIAVVFVTIMATLGTWLIQYYVLNPLNIAYLQTLVFILVIAALVQFVELFLKKMAPPLYRALGIFLPLITTNCCILGIAILVQRENLMLGRAMFYSLASSAGFLLALLLMAGIRERLETARIPRCLTGVPTGLILAGLMSLSFMAFQGMVGN